MEEAPTTANPSGVDLSGVEPVPYKKTLVLVNSFVVNTTEFINKFSTLCETKLQKVSQGIARLEIVMAILEAKLNSIPGLEDVSAAPTEAAPSTSTPAADAQPAAQAPAPQANGAPADTAPASAAAAEPSSVAEAAPEPEAESGGVKMKDNPLYSKYFKMVNMGIPEASVKQKMMMEGINPDVLDTPDAISTDAPPPPQEESESESEEEFSD